MTTQYQDDHDGSGCGEGERARRQVEKDKRGPGPRCWNCDSKITHQQAAINGTLCDECKASQPQTYEVPVPENDEQDLFDAVREQLSPQAVASIVAHIHGAATNNVEVDQQVLWFCQKLTELLGGNEQFTRLAEELGL